MNNNTINLASAAVNMMPLSSEYLLNNNTSKLMNNNLMVGQQNRERLSEGLNNITKSILQTRNMGGNVGGPINDRILRIDEQDDIPLRPLLLNGNTNQMNNAGQQDKMQE